MKILFSLLVAVLLLPLNLFSQPSLDFVWKKNVFPTQIEFAKFSKDGNFIYCAVGNNIQVMDAKTGEFVDSFDNTGSSHSIDDMDISENGEKFVTAHQSAGAVFWDIKLKKIINKILPDTTINNQRSWIECATIFPDGKFGLLGQITLGNTPSSVATTNIIIYDIEQGKEINRIQQSNRIYKIQISHDGRFFVTGSTVKNFDNTFNDQLILWDAVTMLQISVLESINTGVTSGGFNKLIFSIDDKYLGSVRKKPWEVLIHNLVPRERIKKSDGRSCVNIEYLPDSTSYMLSYIPAEIYDINTDKLIEIMDNYMGRTTSSFTSKKLFVQNGDSIFLYSMKLTDNIELAMEEDFKLKVTNNQITIYSVIGNYQNVNIRISDLLGKIYYEKNQNIILQYTDYPIALNLPSGIYLCKVTAENKEYTQKFEIVR